MFFTRFFPRLLRVQGVSMAPALRPGQVILALPVRWPPRRGDVVLAHMPGANGTLWVKRVIGLPGERVRVDGEGTHVNGALLPERGVLAWGLQEPGFPVQEWALGPCECLLLGDNRADSVDSRRHGPVPRAALAGRIGARVWPLRAVCLL
ncbi:MAG: signal peptidase I [Chloroflexota bacterium]